MDNSTFDINNAHFVCEFATNFKDYKAVTKRPHTNELIAVTSFILGVILSIFIYPYNRTFSIVFISIIGCLITVMLFIMIMQRKLMKNREKTFKAKNHKISFYDGGLTLESSTSSSTSQSNFEYAFMKTCRFTNEYIIMKSQANTILIVKRESLPGAEYYDLVKFLYDIMCKNGIKVVWGKNFTMPGV